MEKTELMKRYEAETGKQSAILKFITGGQALEQKSYPKLGPYDYNMDYIAWLESKAEAYDRLMSGGKKAIEETCKVFKISDIGEFSDGFHTFNSLYHQRAVLFATLVNTYSSHSWKSYRHEDGQICFGGGWFIVGIDTPKGSYTYHYEHKYWDMFNCQTYENAKHWDGHTDDDVERLLTLPDGWEEK